jgi:hypothetical protein
MARLCQQSFVKMLLSLNFNAETLVIWLAEEYGVNIVFMGPDIPTKEMTQ